MDALARLASPVAKAFAVRWVALGAGIALAGGAAAAAPSNVLLPGPQGALPTVLSAAVLFAAFAVGYVRPLQAVYGLVALVVLEGAIRKWLVNDVTVFLAKDFLALGMYAAVLPRLRRDEIRRPWWLLAPLAAILALAVISMPLGGSLSVAVVGLRSYLIYVPLLWVAPALMTTRKRVYALAGLVLILAAASGAFAVVQALSGASVLNKVVSGALAGIITVNRQSYIRPSGTFMQVGVLAAFLFFGSLIAFALVFVELRGRWLVAGLIGFGFIVWGAVYSSARSLLGSLILVYVVLAALLIWRRRIVAAFVIPAMFGVSILVLFVAVPWVQHEGVRVAHSIERRSWTWVAIPQPPLQTPFRLRVPPAVARGLPARIRTSPTDFSIQGIDTHGDTVIVEIRPRHGVMSQAPPAATVLGVDAAGRPIRVTVGQAGGGTAGGFLGRAADFNTAGGDVGLWSSRIRPQLSLIAHQGIIGHGTGTMTLGSGYADGGPTVLQGEGMYSKLAWELGWIGLVLFLWFAVATLVLAVLGLWRVDDWRRLPAFVGAAAAAVLPIWYLFTFALDFPVVGILFWSFAGCAVAYGSGAAPRRAYATSDARPASFPAKEAAI